MHASCDMQSQAVPPGDGLPYAGTHPLRRPPPAAGYTRSAARAACCRRLPAPQTTGCEQGCCHCRCGMTLAPQPRLRWLGRGGRGKQAQQALVVAATGWPGQARIWYHLNEVQPASGTLCQRQHQPTTAAAAHPAACTAGRRSTQCHRGRMLPPRRAPPPPLLSSLQGGFRRCGVCLQGGRDSTAVCMGRHQQPDYPAPPQRGCLTHCSHSCLARLCPPPPPPPTHTHTHLGAPPRRRPAAWLGSATARPCRCCWNEPRPTRRPPRL